MATDRPELPEEKDESFEIISLKQKYFQDQLAIVEDSLIKAELNVTINKKVIAILTDAIKKESDKNAH